MMPKPTTLFVTLEYPPQVGGVAHFYQKLIEPLTNFAVLTSTQVTLTPWWWQGWRTIYHHLRTKGYQTLVVGQILPLGTIAIVLKLLIPFRLVLFTHGMDITIPQRYWRKRVLLRWILQRSDAIITISHYSAQQLIAFQPSSQAKIQLLPPGPFTTPATVALSVDQPLPKRFMLSVGRLVERKGFASVIKALPEILRSCPDVHYIIAGSGPQEHVLHELITSLGLNNQVTLLTTVSHGQLATLYQQSDFLVFPARVLTNGDYEGFGITVLEAATFAKPAIVSAAGGMPDTIQPNQTGSLVDPENLSAIAQLICQWWQQPNQVKQYGQAAQQWVAQQHSWKRKSEQFAAICRPLE